ncbi:SAM-dependent methyltransferase [Kurthia zopfii]|uniref:tRNA (Adenine(22)-N(1))-methyltransferase n=1 Tax=Kurthia zopfii TaxID=1650 RepID=A0A8B4QBG2_9BACL|nr:tRNA (adenine(22)-N(1))-methyltransferase TrmK [Kurthia zopfii]PWI24100.1 tRNA (adenine(22)-N(1))-methyltransferase TrmK [Kurthia zopfii]TDR44357.1 tRNA (adenine22-N1)-methyltransferase [Kurthia zopfii]GEK32200.1 SAM-dependent methyltransferase [Kurthia zopfii]STX10037.1 tRNA (adenine(22)-N(1))-methyltransferase [Kurthia zopfii]
MNAQRLSKRLEKVASFVPEGAVVADIGSDHAYLPCYLVNKGIVDKAIAGEVVKGPYESACNEVKKEKLQNQIEVRFADGMEAISAEDGVTAVTIAGMGGPLIASILNKDLSRLETVERLILQPNIHAISIRQWAKVNGWKIVDEAILMEDDKIYEIIVLERGEEQLSEAELLMGPFLLKEKNEVFVQKWLGEIKQWQFILESVKAVMQTEPIKEKIIETNAKIQLVEEVL